MIDKNIKVDVGFILTGRDDGYTGNFIDRFAIALNKNLEILSRHNLKYKIIVVDYNPYEGKRLIDNSALKQLLNHDNVLNVIVDRSVIVDDGLPENGFYEYFGKNIGARYAFSRYFFMTNADIIISNDIVKFLEELSQTEDNNHFYRLRYRQDILDGVTINAPLDLHSPNDPDEPICGGYSGDATIFSKEMFIDCATGYNETDPNHRTTVGQASMDGEILWNLVKKGKSKKLVNLIYYHVCHPRQTKDSSYSKMGYDNRENWGCKNHPFRVINENTIEIYK